VHEHTHDLSGVTSRLRVALILTIAILVAEVVGGVLANSLALLSDAIHVLTDILAIGLAWYAARQAERPPTLTRTFGFHRTGILAALANAAMLVLIAILVIYEAYQRLARPEPVESRLLFVIAIAGLIGNVGIAYYLHREQSHSLSVRSAFLHVVGDAMASIGVIFAAVVIYFTDLYVVDPILSVLISFVIVWSAWQILRETVDILMEGTPREIDLNEVAAELGRLPGVQDVHDLHVWSIATGLHSLSCHILVSDQPLSESSLLLARANAVLREKFNIEHATIQFEHQRCGLVCVLNQGRLSCQ